MATDKTHPITYYIDDVIAKVPGWTLFDQLLCLFNLTTASSHLAGDILEIGSWCNRSTLVMAKALEISQSGRILSIDLFSGREDWKKNQDGSWSFLTSMRAANAVPATFSESASKDAAPLSEQHDPVLDIFISSLRLFNLERLVDFHKGSSESYEADASPRTFRLALIDGGHNFKDIAGDIAFALRHMPNGGWLCFADAFSYNDTISQAIEEHVWTSKRVSFSQQLCRKFHCAKVLPQPCQEQDGRN